MLDVTRYTAREYALLETALATTYLAKVLRRDRPRWLESWVEKSTGQAVQVDENDLWICAQARERFLLPDAASQARRPLLEQRLRAIAGTA